MYKVYSVHNLCLGEFNDIADAMRQSDGWEIRDASDKVLLRRLSFDYRDNRWYQP